MLAISQIGPLLSAPTTEVQRAQRNALVLLAGAALTLVPHFFYLPPLIWGTAALLLAVRGWLTLHNKPGPRGIWLIGFAVVLGFSVWQLYGTLIGREAGVASLVLLAGFKLLEMRARRDLFVVVFLCFFLLLTQFFNAQTFLTFLTGVIALIVLIAALVLFHSGDAPATMLRASMKDAARMLAIAAPLTIMAFVLFPRATSPLWGLPSDAFKGRSGLSDTMTPGQISELALSDEVAMRVKFSGPLPLESQRYFRGPVLTAFDGRTWRASVSERLAPANLPVTIPDNAQRYVQDITLEPHQRFWIFALEQPIKVPSIDGLDAQMSFDGSMRSVLPVREKLRYTVESSPLARREGRGVSLLSAQGRALYVDIPQGFNPKTLTLAQEMRGKIGATETEPQPFINSVLAMFRQEPFRYTLEPPLLPRDTIDAFLFETRAGFCEHYAQAFVVLMRAMDFPARVVTGYQGGRLDPADNTLIIQQADAHAWAEVYSPTRGWVRVDPTAAVAPERVERGFTSSFPQREQGLINKTTVPAWLRAARGWVEAAGTFWGEWVVGYSSQRQRDFLRTLGLPDFDWSRLMWALMGAASIGMGLIWWLTRPRLQKLTGVAQLRDRLVKATRARGLAPLPEEGLQTWIARVRPGLPEPQVKALENLASELERISYAPGTAADKQRLQRQFNALLRTFQRESPIIRS
ncbi:MAG: transglutaminaseTgpA domain-containing protein [Burkholderiaceae bacterium]